MGYGVSEVYGLSPLSQLEKGPYVWDIKGYGLWQVWVIRSSTVHRGSVNVNSNAAVRSRSSRLNMRKPSEQVPDVNGVL